GLFSMTVPTGGGKTLTSLAFALDHAIEKGLRRVIFVIPFTSIVEQNAAVFRSALGELGDQSILEHHSAFQDRAESAPQGIEKLQKAMENWEAPIVVTTSVQFFESFYADRPSKCRKLHNISGSVVILDEVQVLPLKLLRPCIAVMDELARNYRTTLVLCTATQPALKAQDEFKGGLHNVRELAPTPDKLFQKLKRVKLHHTGALKDMDIAQRLSDNKQILCVVNNRHHARALYKHINTETGAYHLTTLMCAAHRSQVLTEIREKLKQGKACRLISTSLIEAGVDVDFPIVLRAETGLDSIVQATGRCNREGLKNAEDSLVQVFSVGDEWRTPPELMKYAQAARSVFRQYPDDPLSIDAINSYFRELYWQKGDQNLDEHNILGRIAAGKIENIPYEWITRKFHMIESSIIPVIIPYDEVARQTLQMLYHSNQKIGMVARKLQPYLVQVPEKGYKALKDAGAVQAIQPEYFEEQFLELVNSQLYTKQYGLDFDDPSFLNAQSLVVA
ncbi:MAG: CRISPR-associated helicase Cas3', partial [Candidatus Paceibacteria bacterium]